MGEFFSENGLEKPIQVRFRGKPVAVLVPEAEYRALILGRIALEQKTRTEEEDGPG